MVYVGKSWTAFKPSVQKYKLNESKLEVCFFYKKYQRLIEITVNNKEQKLWFLFIIFFFSFHPPLALLLVLGLLEQYMTPTLDSTLLISSRAGADLGWTLDRLRSNIVVALPP